jgi:CHAT domain-containing protein/tetratricopeptide (TPR) repeat protein
MRPYLYLVLTSLLLSPLLATTHCLLPSLVQAETVQLSKQEGDRLYQEGQQQLNRKNYPAALENFQRAFKIYRQLGDRSGKGNIFLGLGNVYFYQSQYEKALEFYQQALVEWKSARDRKNEAMALSFIGLTNEKLSRDGEALQHYQQALPILKEVGDRSIEGEVLIRSGLIYNSVREYSKALESYQQALPIVRAIGNRSREGTTLNGIGGVYRNLGQYTKALEFHQQALPIVRAISDRSGEGTTLLSMGVAYERLGQYAKALECYRQALPFVRAIGNQVAEAIPLIGIGNVYRNLGQYSKALEFYQQALSIARAVGNSSGEGTTLNNMGNVYQGLDQYAKALEFYQQALAISREIGDRAGEWKALSGMGGAYADPGQYGKALESYRQALAISREIGDRAGEGVSLNNMGLIYRSLGQYGKALESYRQALAISREFGNRVQEGPTLEGIGSVYQSLGQYGKALESYRQALAIHREFGHRSHEVETLNSLGAAYNSLGQYTKALESYQQALIIVSKIGHPKGKGTTLNNLSILYAESGQYSKSLECLQQALQIVRAIGDRAGEGRILSNIGFLLQNQNRSELAIVFYKQSVNVIESIRQDLRRLPREQQQSYTQTVADSYRELADLLLQRNRILEAQQVLDLLKVQELSDYLRNVRGNPQTARGIENLPPELEILKKYEELQKSAIQVGKELTDLRKLDSAGKLPAAQKQRMSQLVKIEANINQQFNAFLESSDVRALVSQLSRTAKQQALDLADLNALRDNLRTLDQAVLLYPLILDDRLELILMTPDAAPLRRTVAVKRVELNRAVVEFRAALQNPNLDAKTPAQKLYNWLIKPLEADLKQANAQTIIYAPDGQLRYIPLAALYDGKQWLVQNYRVNNITAKSLTDLNTKPQSQSRAFAGAFVNGRYRFKIGQTPFDFRGLPATKREVEFLTASFPGTAALMDNNFSKAATTSQMNSYGIVHLATHAAFVVGTPDASFILFGNGDRATLTEIQDWTLSNVDLVVLSACETGLGGQFGNGEEILGMGYQFQRAGARAAIASLWSLNDGGTQALMSAFYAAVKSGKMTKAEALRQAQIALIQSNSGPAKQSRGIIGIKPVTDGLPSVVIDRLSHPYYWAPFILIGNGL